MRQRIRSTREAGSRYTRRRIIGPLTMAELTEALKRAILADGRTPYQIAKAAGINRSAISRLLAGERGVSLESLESLAATLGFEVLLKKKKRS